MSTIETDPKTQKIVIVLPRKGKRGNRPPGSNLPPPDNSGLLPVYTPPVKRRKRVKKSGGLMTFSDMSYFRETAEDDYAQRDLAVLPPIVSFDSTPYLNQLRDKLNTPLSFSIDSWGAHYLDVTDSIETYRLQIKFNGGDWKDLNADNEDLSEDGLKFKNFTQIAIRTKPVENPMPFDEGGTFPPIDIKPVSRFKVTNENSFASPDVPLSIDEKKPVEFYLNPATLTFNLSDFPITNNNTIREWLPYPAAYFVKWWQSCSAERYIEAERRVSTFEQTRDSYTMNYFWSFWERNLVNNEALRVEDEDFAEHRRRTRQAMEMLRHARAYKESLVTTINRQEIRPVSTPPDDIILCGWGLPSPYDVTTTNSTEGEIPLGEFPYIESPQVSISFQYVTGKLAGALKQGDNTFYLWEKF